MTFWQDGVIAALAAIGLSAVVWFTAEVLLHPRRAPAACAVVIPARDDAPELEHTVRALQQQRFASGTFGRIVVLDCGLREEGRRIASLLCRDGYGVSLCTKETLLTEIGGTEWERESP